jgi:hypothetical protein
VIAIARSCIRGSARGRSYNVVDLLNRLEIAIRNERQRRLAEHLTSMGRRFVLGRQQLAMRSSQ